MMVAPRHGIYRCHDCNWRGWKVRSSSSAVVAWTVLFFNAVVILVMLGVIIYSAIGLLPKPKELP
jgi:hypothetical protein